MMSKIPLKKSLNTISYQISEEIENILLNEKGEPKLDATVKWQLSGITLKKQKKKNNKNPPPLECLYTSLSHSTGMKNCVLQELHWVDRHYFICNKTIKPVSHFILVITTEFQEKAKLTGTKHFLVYSTNVILDYIFLLNHGYLVVKMPHPGRVH